MPLYRTLHDLRRLASRTLDCVTVAPVEIRANKAQQMFLLLDISRSITVIIITIIIISMDFNSLCRLLKVKVKFSHYRPEQALGDPEG